MPTWRNIPNGKHGLRSSKEVATMEGIQQGRLWAVRNSQNSPIMHGAESGLPILSKTRKGIEEIKKYIDRTGDCNVEIIEVDIVEKK